MHVVPLLSVHDWTETAGRRTVELERPRWSATESSDQSGRSKGDSDLQTTRPAHMSKQVGQGRCRDHQPKIKVLKAYILLFSVKQILIKK